MFKLKSPVTMQMELTEACDQTCLHCYNYWRTYLSGEGQRPKIEDIPEERFTYRIDRMADAEVFYVTLTGGEPLLRRDILYNLIGYFGEKGIDSSVNSNLSAASDEDVKRLARSGIKNILTSLSSYDENTHNEITHSRNHRKTTRNIEIAVSQGISLGVSMVVTQLNKDHVYKTGRMATELGASSFYATPMSPCKQNIDVQRKLMLGKRDVKRVLHELVRLEEEYGVKTGVLEPVPHCLIFHDEKLNKFLTRICSAGVSTATVGVDGEVRPCSHAVRSYGNLDDEDLLSIWSRMSDWKEHAYVPKECEPCDVVDRCLGGCRVAAEANEGNLGSMHYLMEGPLKLRKETPKKTKVNTETILVVPSDIRHRTEKEGLYLLYRSPMNTAVVSEAELRFLGLLSQDYPTGFTLKRLEQDIRLDDNCAYFFDGMIKAGILVSKR